MKHFRPNPLALAACLALLAAPFQVLAQESQPAKADDNKLETVVVKGVRQAIKSAEDAKRTADQVLEAINAEDIGKFPDKSVGEALQRLPGVQVGRNGGEVTEVLIRGLPDVATTFNGHELFTGNGRRLAYQDLPVEAVQSLQIYKSATPDQAEGGIAGLMNVRSRRPFDFAGDTTVSLYGRLRNTDVKGNQASSFSDPTIGGLVSKRVKTDHGEMGVLFDAAYIKDRYQAITQWVDLQDRLWAVKPDGTGVRLNDGENAPAGTTLASLPNVGGVYGAGERKRPMAHLALQWKPSSDLELNAQALHMGFKARLENDFIFAITTWAPSATNIKVDTANGCLASPRGTVCPVISASVPAVSDAASGAYTTDPYTATSTQALEQKTNTDFFSVGANWKHGPLRIDSDLAYNRSKFVEDRIIVDQSVLSPSVNIYTYDGGGHGGFTVTNPSSTSPLKDPNQFRLRGLYQSWAESSGNQVQWRNDATYKLGDGLLRELMGGLRLSSRQSEYAGAEQGKDVPNIGAGRNIDRPIAPVALGAASQALVPGIDRLGGSFITPSSDYLLDNRDAVRQYYGLSAGRQAVDPLRSFDQRENSTTIYGAGRFATEIGGVDISGVAGVRVINTKRHQKGTNNFGGVMTPFDTTTSDTDVLPSLNTKFVWGDNWQSRLAIGKTISRPDFASLNPSLNLTPPAPPNRPVGSGSGGNADLKPVESTSIDLTTEYYFDKNGLAGLALFHRKIDGYIYGLSNRETIGNQQYDISRPFNSGKGTLRGFELTVQKFLDMLPGWMSGFGVAANYTQISGNTRVATDLAQTNYSDRPLFGVAKKNLNASLLYEKDGFNARLTANRRDKYLEGIVGIYAMNQWVKATTFVDFGVGYQINSQLSVQFDAGNLTNANYESYQETENRPRDIRYWNRNYALSLRYKL